MSKPASGSKKLKGSQAHLIALEPRMMFDGALVATVADSAANDLYDPLQRGDIAQTFGERGLLDAHMFDKGVMPAFARHEFSGGGGAADAGDRAISPEQRHADLGAPQADRQEIIFIDTSINGYQGLVDEWQGRGEIVLIDSSRDGIDQMMAALAGRSGIDAIHIVSHGAANHFQLGTTDIDANSAMGSLASSLAAIGAKLAPSGDLLIYGCDVSLDDAGQRFIDSLAAVTGADVAASIDDTGAAALGGDWDLESRSGVVEAGVLISDRYAGLLQLTNSGAWSVSGNTATTTVDGVGVTINFINATTATWTNIAPDTFNTIAAFTNNVQGTPSVAFVWNTPSDTEVGQVTITFTQAVTNPIINFDRLGGISGDANSSIWTITTAGATLTRLTGPSHFEVNAAAGTVFRTLDQTTTGTESNLDGTLGTAAGSVQVNGTFTTLTFNVRMENGATGGSGIGDGVELGVSLNRNPPVVSLTGTNLLTNGGFESGFTGWTSNVGGEVSSNEATYGIPANPEGNNFIELEGLSALSPTTTPIFVETTVPTVAGQTYTVYLQAVSRSGQLGDRFTILANGTAIDSFTTTNAWETYGVTFTATGATTTLRLASAGSLGGSAPLPGDGSGTLIDDVRVVATNNTATFTENGSAVAISTANNLAFDGNGSTLRSGTITLTNAQAGDQLLVNGSAAGSGSLTGGISYTLVGNTVTFTGVSSEANYAAAIRAVQFTNSSENPNTTQRVINVTVNDGAQGSNTAQALINVISVNDAPSGADKTITTNEDVAVTLTAADFGFTDPLDANSFLAVRIATLPAGTFTNNGVPVVAGSTVTVADINAGRLVWTPAANANGTALTNFTFQVQDNGGTTNGGVDLDPTPNTITFNVTAVNDAPVRVGTLPARTNIDAASGINVPTAGGFSDVDNATLTYSAAGLPAGLSINPTTGVITGTIDRSASQGGTGGVYSVVVTATDAGGLSTTQTFSWTVTNPAPTAANNTASTNEDTPIPSINVLGNDSDPDGDPLTVTSASAANGTVTINGDGTLRYVPNANFNGTDTITYSISDGQGGTATATVTVTVAAVNDAPTPVGTLPARANVDAATGINVPTAGGFADVDNATLTYSASGLPAGLSINPTTGVITGTIDRSASQGGTGGVYSVVVTATDAGGLSTTQTFSWTVTNPAPTAANNTASTNEDTPIPSINVLGNDSDPDGDPLTVTSASAANGTVTINGDGTLRYVPNANFNGTDTITYSISDGQGGTATATVTVTVAAVNDAPIRVGTLPARTNVDAASGISVPTAGGFTDVDNATLTYSATGLPAGLSINPTTGVITGTIDRSASQGGTGGVYSVVVTATDAGGLSTTQTFSWTVTNPAPTAANNTASTNEDTPIPSINVLGNDSDPDGDPLTVTSASAANGTVTINGDGTLRYVPNANFNGTDTITYSISDGQGGTATATVTVTVAAVNDAPTPVGTLPPRTNVDAASGISVPTAGGFTDVDNATLTYSATGLPAGLSINPTTGVITGTIDRSASQGGTGGVYSVVVTATDAGGLSTTQTFSWTVTNPAPVAVNDTATTAEDTPVLISVLPNDSDPDGDPLTVIAAAASVGTATVVGNQVQYVPPANFNGTATITYTISDGQGGTSTATITVTVTPVNDAPVATPIPPRATTDGATISVPVAGNFSDVDGNTLSYSAAGLPPGLSINPTTGVISGTITANASQTNGGVYTATITASDGNGGTVSQTITFNVSNPPPVATNDTAATPEDTPVTIAVLANDSDPDGDPLTVTAASATNGTVTINPNGTVTYTPNPGFNGTDTITYTISDGNGGTSTATVTVSVADVNDVPVLSSSIANQTNLDAQVINLPVAGAFSDPDGDTLTYTVAGLPAGLSINPTTGVITGTIDRSASQSNGGVYSVTVTASDGRGGTVSTTFTWTVANPAPTAANDSVTTAEDTAVRVPVLANDADPDGDPLRVTAASAGHGTVTINGDGSLLYTPDANFNGTDTIIYTITDSEGGVSTASVTVTVTPVNDAPTTVGLPNQNGDDGATVSIPTASAFNDVDGDALTFTASGLPPTLSIDPATGLITGTLAPGTSQGGPYIVTVTATDPSGKSVSTTFVYSVQNIPPVAVNDVATTPEDTPVTVAVLTNDSDPDGDPLTITSASANNGTVVINSNGTLTFTPNPDFNGVALVSYTISDGNGGIATATLTVTVAPVNDAPTADPLPNEFGLDNQAVSVGVGSFFDDKDGDTLSFSATGLPSGLSISSTGVISGTIDRNASQVNGGVYSVTVTGTDPGGLSVSRTFSWTITNPAPTATNDTATTAEDTPVAIPVLGNDTDPDGDTLTVVSATALNGTVTIGAGGVLTYTPNANFNGTDTITYSISDGNGGSSTATVTVTVTPVNDPPVALNDVATTNEDTPVTIGVLGNDSDLDGDTLTVTSATSPNGTVTINPDGTISFTPAANFNGPTTITYTISDGKGGTATATVNVTVNAVNDAPVANPSTATTNEDTPVNVPVLANDTDLDGDPLTVTAASAPNGTVVINPDGTVTYTPNPNFNGTDTITYTISDGKGGFSTSTVSVTVNAVNDAPTAVSLANLFNSDSDPVTGATAVDITGSFNDVDGDTLTYTVAPGSLPPGLTLDPATGIISGTIAANASQGGPGGDGVYFVTITANDGKGGTVDSSFFWIVDNPAPVATNDSATTSEDTPVTIAVLTNDSDPDGDTLSVTTATAANGTVVVNPNGTISYTPNANFNGTDTITYTISDGNGGTATAIVTVTVNPVNDAPVVDVPIANQSGIDSEVVSLPVAGNFSDLDGDTLSFSAAGLPAGLSINPATGVISGTIDKAASQVNGGIYAVTVTASDGKGGTVSTTFTYSVANPPPVASNDNASTNEDTPVTIPVLSNDSDPDGDALTVTTASAPNGTVTINPNGTITYTPNANFNGTDTITYTISDGNGGTSTATVTVTVNPVNDAPVATPIAPQTNPDADVINLPIAGNFSDVDGNPLTYSATGLPAGLSINPTTGVISGTIDKAASQANGGIYSVTVTANDGNGGTVSTTFNWTVTNPAPTAVNDSATTNEDTPVTIPVLTGPGADTDPDGDPLTVTSATAPNGTVTINPDGTITYVPRTNFNGTDTITYSISDGNGGTSTATVTVTVNPVNDAPVSTPIAPQSDADASVVTLSVAGNFSDVDNATLSYSATGLPAGLSINPTTGVITGTIDRSASQTNGGVYSVTVTATDAGGLSTTQTFSWTVTNPAPTAANNTASTSEDTPIPSINVLGNDSDPDGDPLTVTSASAANGTVTINGDGTLRYVPNTDFNGTDTITYTISDGQGGTATATVTVTVNAINDAPTPVGALPARTNFDAASGISVPTASGFADIDNVTLSYSASGLPAGLSINPTTGVITGTIDRSASQTNGGVYSVTVAATDAGGLSATQTFVWTVTNPAPTAVNDSATTNEDTPVTIPVLTGPGADTDPDGDPLTVTSATAPNGSVVINPDGTITYTPNANFKGTDTITYTISDGQGGTSTANVTVTVASVNDAPVSVGLPNLFDTNNDFVAIPVASAFSDVDGDTLSYTVTGLPAGVTFNPATGQLQGQIDAAASAGGPNSDGIYTVTVTASDGNGGTVTTSFTWTITNIPPTARDDIFITNEDVPVTMNVTANDTDPDSNPGTPIVVLNVSPTNGTAVINPDNSVTFTPDPGFNGTATVTYTISDGLGGFSTAVAFITINPVNDAPIASPLSDRASMDGDVTNVSVAANFSDPDGDTLTYTATGLPAGLSIDPATGLITGTIDKNASQPAGGSYLVQVTATDPAGLAATTTFTWQVTNPAPTAVNDSATTSEDTPVTVPVLTGPGADTDPDGDPLTVTSAAASNGTVVINPDGTITYTPNANFNGTDTINYTISDGNGGTATASVVVTVTPTNDAPVATPLTSVSSTDSSVITLPVAGNFSDVDGDTLTYSATGLPTGLSINPTTGVISGTIDKGASQVNGGNYSVTVTASDGNGGLVTSTFSFTVTNPPPVAADDSATTNEDTPVTIAVLTGPGADTDPDGDALTVTAATASNGTVVINPDGTITYTPNPNFNGTDTISYTISDGNGGFSTATVVVTVTPVNDAPVATPAAPLTNADSDSVSVSLAANFSDVDGGPPTFSATGLPAGLTINPTTGEISGTIDKAASQVNGGVYSVTVTANDGNGGVASTSFSWTVTNPVPVATDDSATTAEDTPVNIPVLVNDSDPDGDTLTVTTANAANGTVTIGAGGVLTYTPNANYNGTDVITYTVSDGNGGTATATVVVTITPANDPPVASPISPVNSVDNSPVTLPVAGNFSDIDGDTLSFSAAGLPTGLSINPTTGVISGTIDRAASQVNGGVYTVTVTASDGNGGLVSTSFVWTVTNPAPTAANDTASTPEDTPVTIAVLTNDNDPDGDPLTVTTASAGNGTVVINPDGTITYTPNANFNGTDTISYTISDGNGGVSSATVTVTVAPVNDPPVATDDAASTNEDVPVTVAVLPNDSDIDGDPLTVTAASAPNGTVTINPDGTIRYTPNANFNGTDTITYTISDGKGGTDTATVTVVVRPVNDAPVALNDSATTPEDTPVTVNVLGNDSDVDGDPLTVTAATSPDGQVTINPDGTITFVPRANFNGTTTVTYSISDGKGGTATATVLLTVSPVNDVPVANPSSVTINEDTPVTVAVLANDTDADGDPLTVTAASAANGTVTINPDGTVRYVPNPNFNGTDTITYTISDGKGGTSTSTVTVTVNPVNDVPVATPSSAVTPEDTPIILPALGNVTDADGDPLTITAASSPNGTVTINPDGTLTFTPNANFNGPTTVTYTVSDGKGGTVTSTIAVTVTPVNDSPVARPDTASTSEDVPVRISPLANDSDVDGNPLTITAASSPNGTVVINADGTITYTPDPNFNGTDTITYSISDGRGGTSTATITVTVAAVNDPPVATNDVASTDEETPVVIPVLANDRDADGDPIRVTAASAGNGTVTINADGTITYTPRTDFFGTDTISYTISDGRGGTSTASVVVTVRDTNEPPLDGPETISTIGGVENRIPVLANARDPDGNPLSVFSAKVDVGTVVINADGTLSYTAPQGFQGVATITYVVSDGRGGFVLSTVTVNVQQAAADVNALLGVKQPGIPDGWPVDRVRDQTEEFISVPLIIVDTANGFRGLNGTPDLGAERPLLTAINGLESLKGTTELGDQPINDVVGQIDRIRDLRFGADRYFDERFGDFLVKSLTGFSVRQLSAGNEQVMIESVVRDRVIYMEMRDIGKAGAPDIVEFQLKSRDGKPLPDWIRMDSRGLAIIERPVDAEEVRLIVRAIRADGTVVEIPVVVQGATGEIQLDEALSSKRIGSAETLGRTLADASSAATNEAARLAAAFNSQV